MTGESALIKVSVVLHHEEAAMFLRIVTAPGQAQCAALARIARGRQSGRRTNPPGTQPAGWPMGSPAGQETAGSMRQ